MVDNSDFFNKANADLGTPYNDASEEMVKDLLPQGDGGDGGGEPTQQNQQTPQQQQPQTPPSNEPEFVIQEEGDEDILDQQNVPQDDPKGDEPKDDPEPQKPTDDPRFGQLAESIQGLTELQRQQLEAQQKQTVDTDPQPDLDMHDPESVQQYLDWKDRQQKRDIQDALQQYHNENVVPVQNLQVNHAIQSQIAECKNEFGDRFDYARDKEYIDQVMMKYPGASMSEAFKAIDYERMRTDLTSKLEGKQELANTQTVDSGPASRNVQQQANRIVLKASEADKKFAKDFNMPLDEYMKMKYQGQEQNGGGLIPANTGGSLL